MHSMSSTGTLLSRSSHHHHHHYQQQPTPPDHYISASSIFLLLLLISSLPPSLPSSSLTRPLSLSGWTQARSPSYLADVWVPPPLPPASDSCLTPLLREPGWGGRGEEERKTTTRGVRESDRGGKSGQQPATMTRSWLKLNGLANLFWALMRLEAWVATAWYLSLSSRGERSARQQSSSASSSSGRRDGVCDTGH